MWMRLGTIGVACPSNVDPLWRAQASRPTARLRSYGVSRKGIDLRVGYVSVGRQEGGDSGLLPVRLRPAVRFPACHIYDGHVFEDVGLRDSERCKSAREHRSGSARSAGAMNDHSAAASQLVDDSLNDSAKHVSFALGVVRLASADQILERGRAEHAKGRRVIQRSVVGETYDRLEASGGDRFPGHPLWEGHTREGCRGSQHLIEAKR